jgi:hypothetical protein
MWHSNSIGQYGRRIGGITRGKITVIGPNGVIVGVGTVLERHVADAESGTEDCVVPQPVRNSGTGREIPVSSLHAQVGRVTPHSCQHNIVGGGVVVCKSSCNYRSRGRVEVPAQAEIDSHFRRSLPLVAGESKDPPLPVFREKRVEIASDFVWLIEKEGGNTIACSFCNGIGVRGLCGIKVVCSPPAISNVGQQVIVNAANVGTPFKGVVANNLGLIVDEVYVGLDSDPRHGCVVTCKLIEAGYSYADLPGGERIDFRNVYSGDPELGRIVGSIVAVMRSVAEVGDTKSHFSVEAGRENVIDVDAGTVGGLIPRPLKSLSPNRSSPRGHQEMAQKRQPGK